VRAHGTTTVLVRIKIDDETRAALREYNGSTTLRDIRSTLTGILEADLQEIVVDYGNSIGKKGKNE